MKKKRSRKHNIFWITLASLGLYWVALPPCEWAFLIFTVPAIWFFLIAKVDVGSNTLKNGNPLEPLADRCPTSPSALLPDSAASLPESDVCASESMAAAMITRQKVELSAVQSEKESSKCRRRAIFHDGFALIKRTLGSFYGQIWLANFLFWLLVTFWLTFPHPAVILGWGAVALVMSPYLPLFIGLTRYWVHRQRVSIFFAAPIIWLAMEWFRKHLFGGFSFASLEHAFYKSPRMIQLADPLGEYGVGLMILLVGLLAGIALHELIREFFPKIFSSFSHFFCGESALAATNVDEPHSVTQNATQKAAQNAAQKIEQTAEPTVAKKTGRQRRVCPLFVSLSAIVAILTFNDRWAAHQIGVFDREAERLTAEEAEPFRAALLQNGTTFSFPVSQAINEQIHDSYRFMTSQAAKPPISADLVVWPESCFIEPFYTLTPDGTLPGLDRFPPAQRPLKLQQFFEQEDQRLQNWVQSLNTSLILGAITIEFDKEARSFFYNSAWFVAPDTPRIRYDKMNLVMFGEYLPFEAYLPDWFPLKTLCNTVERGKEPTVFWIKNRSGRDSCFLTNICFESSTPHLITRQLDELKKKGISPDVLVNISNDGWFRGIWQIDYHLATNVFRAVEHRKEVLTATHGGFSAAIDPVGRIQSCGERLKTQIVVANFHPDLAKVAANGRLSLWKTRVFDKLPAICAFLSILLIAWMIFSRSLRPKTI